MFPSIDPTKKKVQDAERFSRLKNASDSIIYPFISSDLEYFKDSTGVSKTRSIRESLTIDERYKLKLWEESVDPKVKKKSKFVGGPEAYRNEIKKLTKKKLRPKPMNTSININEMNSVFETERIEDAAAKKIQRAWIHSKLMTKLRHVFLCMKQAAKIQRCIRGVLARRRVATWFNRRNQLIVIWQCHIRKWSSNRYFRPILAIEKDAAITIQRIVLGKLGRIRWKNIQRNKAATRIQIMWRGVISRAQTDHMWLNKIIVPVQKTIRRKVAAKAYNSIKTEKTNAVIKIQRQYRNRSAIKKLASTLHLREAGYRDSIMGMLGAEEELYEEIVVKKTIRLQKKEFESKVTKILQTLHTAYEDIHFMENDLIELKRQRENLSARAIQQGWVQQLEKNIFDMRNDMTKLKLDTIFTQDLNVITATEHVDRLITEIEHYHELKDMVGLFKEQEIEDNRIRNFQINTIRRKKELRESIGNERRKWRALYYTKNGKPDKLRRPGFPWDPSVFAGPEHMTYCSAVDVNLVHNYKKPTNLSIGTKESIDSTLNQLSLQTYLKQIETYEQTLNPIQKILNNFMAPPVDKPLPCETGWGPEGTALPDAMVGIGLLPNDWIEKREEYKVNKVLEDEWRQEKSYQKRKIFEDIAAASVLNDTDGQSAQSLNTYNTSDFSGSKVEADVTKLHRILAEDSRSTVTSLDSFGRIKPKQSRNRTASKAVALQKYQDTDILLSPQSGTPLTTSNSLFGAGTKTLKSRLGSVTWHEYAADKDSIDMLSETTTQVELKQKMKEEKEHRALLRKERLNSRRKEKEKVSKIPWELLDKLEAEKQAFENEKSYLEYNDKF